MGEIGEIPVAVFHEKGWVDQWFPLKPKKGSKSKDPLGKVRLQIFFGIKPFLGQKYQIVLNFRCLQRS